jgi:hypothetical protein
MGSLPWGVSNQISASISHFVNVRQLMVIPQWSLWLYDLSTIFCCQDTGIVDLNATKGRDALSCVGPVLLAKGQKCIKENLYYVYK